MLPSFGKAGCRDCIGAVSIYPEGTNPKWLENTSKKKEDDKSSVAVKPSKPKLRSTTEPPRSTRCLVCFEKLPKEVLPSEYHPRCSARLFGTPVHPLLDFTLEDMNRLAQKNVVSRTAVTGVQPKLSLHLETAPDRETKRLTVVGLWGTFILKPPTEKYPQMATVESATMQMAKTCGISVAENGLIRLKSGDLAYIARRFDRVKKAKLQLEDTCQLSELLTEKKYKSSMEKVGTLIRTYSSFTGLDLVRFFDIALFSFLTGNADMHLKNFSLLTREDGRISLSPAYDLLATKLLVPKDQEEMALTLNGKRSKLKRADFTALAATLSIPAKAAENAFNRLEAKLPALVDTLEQSFMSAKLKTEFKNLIRVRARTLGFHFPSGEKG